ncbi:MAG: hypothetical protein HWE13_09135 [Gammaproteobacteria bacterium]|nr:hypothetical protein [Gammaproteobacteria bacterium]NVK88279.1 hypothetical protein [Gammaproteobacteria bacterium]
MKHIAMISLILTSLVAIAAEQEPTATTVVREAKLGLTITGNQELPNILYIVPWQKGPANDISPIQGRIVDEVYGPVEVNVFQRKVKLHRAHKNKKETSEQ